MLILAAETFVHNAGKISVTRNNYIECPAVWNPRTVDAYRKSIFLAGGISGCENWQKNMASLLSGSGLTILNPRREDFDVDKPGESNFQIEEWEYIHLRKVRARLFWFPNSTLCPITLLELGKFMEKSDPLFVGVDPEYKRKLDVEVQLSFSRPFDCQVHYSLENLAKAVKSWAVSI